MHPYYEPSHYESYFSRQRMYREPSFNDPHGICSRSVDTWLEKLAATKCDGWRVLPNGNIRDRDGRCPIIAVLNAEFPHVHRMRSQVRETLSLCGVDTDRIQTSDAVLSIHTIMAAADAQRGEVRTKMLAVLGLVQEVRYFHKLSHLAYEASSDQVSYFEKQFFKQMALLGSKTKELETA